MIQCARPGMVVGRGGEDIKKLEEELTKKYGKKVRCSIIEIKNPDTNATLVAVSYTHLDVYKRQA